MITTSTQREPGIYPDVSFEDYLAWPEISQSVLKEGRASMAHLKAAMDMERIKVPTDDMLLGSALHTVFLEPEAASERVVKWTGGTRRGKAWDEFNVEHAGKIILTETAHAHMVGMVRSLRRHPVIRQWVGSMEATEVAAVGDIEGVRMKGRCDALTTDPMFDLKKVRSGDPRTFTQAVLNFGYDMQAYTYQRLFNRERFILATVEDAPPYDVVCYELSPSVLRRGEEQVCSLLQRFKFCQRSGVWPGRSDEVVLLELPDWAAPEADDITIDGEAVHEE